jgi:hypothetical protein
MKPAQTLCEPIASARTWQVRQRGSPVPAPPNPARANAPPTLAPGPPRQETSERDEKGARRGKRTQKKRMTRKTKQKQRRKRDPWHAWPAQAVRLWRRAWTLREDRRTVIASQTPVCVCVRVCACVRVRGVHGCVCVCVCVCACGVFVCLRAQASFFRVETTWKRSNKHIKKMLWVLSNGCSIDYNPTSRHQTARGSH